jgi:hypothetical protein
MNAPTTVTIPALSQHGLFYWSLIARLSGMSNALIPFA